MWVFAILAISIGAMILIVVAMLAGPLIAPLYEIVVNDPAVIEMGYDVGATVAVRIGLKFVLPLLALTLAVWFLVMRLMDDTWDGVTRR